MIIYGTKSTRLIVDPINNECPHCHTINTMDMYVFQRYVHLFWLPIFPLQKTGVSQCNHCRQVLKQRQMSPGLRVTLDKVKAQVRTPFWVWIGTALVLLVMLYLVLHDMGYL